VPHQHWLTEYKLYHTQSFLSIPILKFFKFLCLEFIVQWTSSTFLLKNIFFLAIIKK